MKRKLVLSLLFLTISSALLGVVGVSALTGYTIGWWAVDGGGAASSVGGSYNLDGTIGQPAPGTSSGGTYTLEGGFWNGDAAVVNPPANQPPTDIALTNSSVTENSPIGSLVGNLSTVDADLGDSFTYSFCGGADDISFMISGDQLLTQAVFNFEAKKSYDVCIQTDDGTDRFDKHFSIAVTNVADYEIAKNGGFETYIGTSKKPVSWVAVNFSTLDGKNTTHQAGKYSVKLTGKGTITKTLTQTLTGGLKGDIFAFSYWVKGSALPKTGTCQAQVILYKTGGGTSTYTLKCPTTATTFTWKQMKLNFTASANYSKVVIKFTFKKTSGSVWFDGVSVKR